MYRAGTADFVMQPMIKTLGLTPHPEGGYYREIHKSGVTIETKRPGSSRSLFTTIYYLLTRESPIGHLHRNASDITHFFHLGSPIKYFTVSPEGVLDTFTLGANIDEGERLQFTVPGGHWKGSVLEKGDCGLISEVVSPGFDWRDMEIAKKIFIEKSYPGPFKNICHLIAE